MKSQIDELIHSLYSNIHYGELEALSCLISDKFITGLEDIFNAHARNTETFKSIYRVSLGWIDKIPLAKFVDETSDINNNLITEKVEIGDLLIIQVSNDLTNKRKRQSALIVQTKISDCINPTVPISIIYEDRINSTSKELALLSKWPVFDLYRTSTSGKPEISNIAIEKNNRISKFSGYYDKVWYCGDVFYDNVCNISLGGIFNRMIQCAEGKEFYSNTDDHWSTLINKILVICNSYSLPSKYYSESNKSRLLESDSILYKMMLENDLLLEKDLRINKGAGEDRLPIILIDNIQIEGKDDINKYR